MERLFASNAHWPSGSSDALRDALNVALTRTEASELQTLRVQANDILERLRELPARPTAMTLLLAERDNPESNARSIADALQSDPSLTARVLHLSNAPYFGLAGRVTSLERAVVALGASTLRSLAVSSATGMLTEDPSSMPDGFWSHSVAVAAAAAVVARECSVAPGDALCAGLLHDLGTALLFRFDRESWQKRIDAGITGDALLEEEDTVYGGDHAATRFVRPPGDGVVRQRPATQGNCDPGGDVMRNTIRSIGRRRKAAEGDARQGHFAQRGNLGEGRLGLRLTRG